MCGLRTSLSLPQTLYYVCPLCICVSWALGSDLCLWDGMLLQSGAMCKSRHITSDDQIPDCFHSRSDKPAFHLSPSSLNFTSTCSLFVFQFEGKKSRSALVNLFTDWTWHATWLHAYQYANYATWKIWWNCDVRDKQSLVMQLNTAGQDGFLREQLCF